ncbi:MAG: hypothetical protein ACLFTK_02545 [Anaerolineales bacterium]
MIASRRNIIGMGVISLGVSGMLALDAWPSLRGDYGWRWGYAIPSELADWLPSALALGLFVLVSGYLWRRGASARAVVAWAFIASAVLATVFLTRWDDPLFLLHTRTASRSATGPQLIATGYTPATIQTALHAWPDEQRRFAEDGLSMHAALAPPGLPLAYYLAQQGLAQAPGLADPLAEPLRSLQCHNLEIASQSDAQIAGAWLGILSPVWAALAVFPLFWLAWQIGGASVARVAVLLWPLVPGIAVFTPVPNTVFPALAVFCVALLWRGLSSGRFAWAASAGAVFGIGLFLNISLVPLAMFCGWLALGYHVFLARPEVRPWWSVRMGAAFGLGLALVWGLWALYDGAPFWVILDVAMHQHLQLDRPYWPWLVLHLWDYVLFLGLPILLLSLYPLLGALRERGPRSPGALLMAALVVTLLILTISGTARGETGRVWQFFFPFSVIGAALALDAWRAVGRGLALQAVYCLVIVLFIPVIATELTHPSGAYPATCSAPG